MARNNMNFSASLRLNTKEFRNGISAVQRSLKSLQSSFLSVAGALGLGMSFSRLGSSLMDTATKLSIAKNTLQNVSKEFGEYGETMEWIRKISSQYGQDMLTLTNSFAQFRAAADSSNLSLDQMRFIYEALTRAAGAYHMSADRTNDMMIAVTQMLSKGKVAAEELRRQLGNSLPGAFNLMAQAAYNAGVITENSTAALEKAMKSGKVMAEDVLPDFAKILNQVTANADFDSLQTSINRLKNSWTELVDQGNFEGFYKGIIDGANSVVKYFTSDFGPKIAAVIGGIFGSTAVANGARKMSASVKAETTAMEKELEVLEGKQLDIRRNLKNFKGYFDVDYSKGESGVLTVNSGSFGRTAAELQKNKKAYEAVSSSVEQYNNNLLQMHNLYNRLYGKKILSKEEIKYIEDAQKASAEFNTQMTGMLPNVNKGAGAFRVFGRVIQSVGAAIKTALSSIAIGAVIAGITYLISKLIEVRKEAKRINNIVADGVKLVEETAGAENDSVIALTNLKRAFEGFYQSASDATKTKLIKEVNNQLGLTGDKLLTIKSNIDEEVIPAIDNYIGKLKYAAQQQAILSQVGDATSRIVKLEAENMAAQLDPNYGKTRRYYSPGSSTIGAPAYDVTGLTLSAQKLQNKIDKNNKEIEQLNKLIFRLQYGHDPDENGPDLGRGRIHADEDTLNAIFGIGGGKKGPGNGGDGGDGGKNGKTDTPASVLKKYKDELQKLNNQLDKGAILAADYNDELKKLQMKTFEDLAGFGWDNVLKGLKTQGDKDIAEGIRAIAREELLKSLDATPQEIADYEEEEKNLADAAYKAWKDAWDKFQDFRKKAPKYKDRDTSEDILLSNIRKKGMSFSEFETKATEDNLDAQKDYIEALKDYIESIEDMIKVETDPEQLKRFNDELRRTNEVLERAKLTATDLQDKANLAKLEADIVELREQGIEQIFSDITNLADGMDRFYMALQNVKQINDKTWKSEEMDKFITYLNAIIQTLEVLKTLYTALNTTQEIFAALKEKNAKKAIILNGAEAASEIAKGEASTAAAAAGAASSVASIPWVGPALAAVAVAGVVAAILAGMKKFANGGFIGGHSYAGDKQVARVNSGELVLNPTQQRNLLNLANGKQASGGQVEFKIRGADLVGSLRNYNRLTGNK